MDEERPEPSRKAAPVTYYEPEILLALTSPSQVQRRAALIIVLGLAIVFVITVPFLAYPLPQINAFIPAFESAIFICYLITAGLLFAQYVVSRSHALLVLASGYLFATLIVIPHALTFPGAFGSMGPLGGGSQSTGWLYFVWHCGFALFVIGYALIKDVDRGTAGEQGSAVGTISSIIGIMIALICGLTWAINAHESNLPRAIGADVSFFARHVPGMVMLVLGLLAIALLWRRRISVLDLWLIVVMFAFLFEIMRVAIGNYPRFSFGFYTVRIFSLVTSTIVLLVLLSQTTALYARLACSNTMLKRERDNKLMNLEAMAASISHEVRQPLTAITTHGSAALRFLGQAPPNLERAQTSMRAVVSDSHRASEVFDNLRTLFGRADKEQEPIDVNEIAYRALRIMQGELKENRITTRVELAPELAAVAGHKGQLQEVFLNLIRNAIDAMGATEDGSRLLRVVTENGRDQIIVAVEDSGPGIDPEKLDRIFDVFVTSKAQGMGLGLAICRMIIDRHGGQLSAWSDKKRGGALFQFTLPIKSAAG